MYFLCVVIYNELENFNVLLVLTPEGMCASFIWRRNEIYVCAGRGHCTCFMLKVKWVV